MRSRIVPALAAVTVVVPAVIAIGGLLLSFVPVLRNGIAPMVMFMAAADGVTGFFFFVFFFGAPVALVLGALAYAGFSSRLRRDPPIRRSWILALPAMLGAALLPPMWDLEGSGVFAHPVRWIGPAFLGALAGTAAGAAFWRIAVRASQAGSAAA